MDEIERTLPHRYPFLLVDRLVERVPGAYARGIKNITRNEWFFQGHFPGEPIMPGVLITEAIAQIAAFACEDAEEAGAEGRGKCRGYGMLAGMKQVRFLGKVLPGDQLELFFRVTAAKGPYRRGAGSASVGGRTVCSIEEMTLFVPKPDGIMGSGGEQPSSPQKEAVR